MKHPSLRTLFLTLALTLTLGVLPAAAAGTALSDIAYEALPGSAGTEVSIQQKAGKHYLFLPASADLTRLTLTFEGGDVTLSQGGKSVTIQSGQPFDLTAAAAPDGKGVRTVTLTRGGRSLTLHILASDHIASLHMTSADPAKDRAWVERSKDNKAKGQALFLSADGTPLYQGGLKQIKGRGNSTWSYPKKPYQIKLEEKADLLGAGEKPESTWVLLANYCDETLIHNQLTYDLAQALALAYTPHCTPVDLYYDGEYRGSYLLSEKTEIGKGRVPIADLEGAIEEANPQVEDMDDLATAYGTTAAGKPFQYVTGLTAPADLSGGYLLELDYEVRAKAEKSWFESKDGHFVVVKSPEYAPREAMLTISDLWQHFEDAVNNQGRHPVTGKHYSEYMDLDSLARVYLIQELSQNGDAFWSSSYFYKPEDEHKLYAGPLWDFDSSYGSADANYPIDQMIAGSSRMGWRLLCLPSFRETVREIWTEELSPLVTQARTQGVTALGNTLADSQAMDHVLWPATTPGSYDSAIGGLNTWLAQRQTWLTGVIDGWTRQEVAITPFADVPEGIWYAPAVAYTLDRGLMNGVSDSHFAPQGTMTRAMAVTVLWRMAGSPVVESPAAFTDVPAGLWYTDAVAWAVENQVTTGYPDGTFLPDQPVNRQELVSLFHRFVLTQVPDLTAGDIPGVYTDRSAVPDWAAEAFGWAVENGILTGTTPTTLDPQGLALRCQGAVFFQRLDQYLAAVTPQEPPEELPPDSLEPQPPAPVTPEGDSQGSEPTL